MSGLFEQQQETEVDNLSEVRIRRFAYYQQAIDAEYVTFKAACEAIKSSSLRMCELLRGAQQERIWAVDGYDSMTHWVESRWPEISKSQLSRAIAGGAILEEYDTWVIDVVAKNGNLATLPAFENQGQLRAMAAIEPENRRPVYELAVETSGGGVPSARIISETNAALNGKHTDERIGRLDTDRKAKPTHAEQPVMNNPPKHRRAWAEQLEVCNRDLQFFTCDHPFTLPSGYVKKTHIFTYMRLVQLSEIGFIHKNDTEGLRQALIAAEARERELDEEAPQKSFVSQSDFSHLDNFLGGEDTPL